MEGYLDRSGKDDPDFVEWQVQMTEQVDGVITDIPLSTHKCNETDYENFYEPNRSYISQLALLKERGNLICLD